MESYSQCGQDFFVFNILKQKTGTFLDLGCYLPIKINNTFLLEKLNLGPAGSGGNGFAQFFNLPMLRGPRCH